PSPDRGGRPDHLLAVPAGPRLGPRHADRIRGRCPSERLHPATRGRRPAPRPPRDPPGAEPLRLPARRGAPLALARPGPLLTRRDSPLGVVVLHHPEGVLQLDAAGHGPCERAEWLPVRVPDDDEALLLSPLALAAEVHAGAVVEGDRIEPVEADRPRLE